MNRSCTLFSLTLLLAASTVRGGPGLTVYNQNFAVVRDEVPLTLDEGVQEVSYSGVTSFLEPESVVLRDASGAADFRVLEQSYRGDPVNQQRLLQMFEGETLSFVKTLGESESVLSGKVIRAPIQSSSGRLEPIVEVDGELMMGLPGDPRFPSLGDGSILLPTLSWKIFSPEPVSLTADLSYLTSGLSWEADYNFVLPENGDGVSVSGWVSVQNRSGKSFEKARIKLIAGDVNKVTDNRPRTESMALMARSADAFAPPEVEQKKFDEFHLYSLPGEIDLRDQETKQLEFVRADPVRTWQTYVYDGASLPGYWRSSSAVIDNLAFGKDEQTAVAIFRSFENTEENQLGVPLPAGTIRFYRADSDGSIEFTGENRIEHTPKGETVRVYLGNAFDLVGERTQTDFFRHPTRDLIRESFLVEIRNRSEKDVEVEVREHLYRWSNWEILKASSEYEKVDSRSIRFLLPVKAESSATVQYTVEYTW